MAILKVDTISGIGTEGPVFEVAPVCSLSSSRSPKSDEFPSDAMVTNSMLFTLAGLIDPPPINPRVVDDAQPI